MQTSRQLVTELMAAMNTGTRDGPLCEHWGVPDELDVLYQVGALTPPEIATQAPD